jgi:hypothetical protein
LLDLLGKHVADLYSGKSPTELHRLKIDVSKYRKGIYLLKLETKEKAVLKKLVIK